MSASRLILGTAQLGMRYGIANPGGGPDRQQAFAILDAARDAAFGGIDTAPDYGLAESRLGEYLKSRQPDWQIATKLPAIPPSLEARALGQYVHDCLHKSLQRLEIDRVDRYLIHDVADLRRYGNALIDLLQAHVEAGLIAQPGVSVYSPEDAEFATQWEAIRVVQHPLNLLDRRLRRHSLIRNRSPQAAEIEARSILLQGILQMQPGDAAAQRIGADDALSELRAVTARFNFDPKDIALPWVFAAGADRAVVGVDNERQLTELVQSLESKLSEDLLAAIDSLSAVPAAVIDPRKWPGD